MRSMKSIPKASTSAQKHKSGSVDKRTPTPGKHKAVSEASGARFQKYVPNERGCQTTKETFDALGAPELRRTIGKACQILSDGKKETACPYQYIYA